MFPDSDIAKKFTCGEKKASYLTCFGIAAHFKNLLKDKNQILLMVMCFFYDASAEDMLEKFHSSKENLNFRNLIQLSRDGPSVNCKFYKMVEDELKNDYSCHVLNTGSCDIHIVHEALKDGCEAADWTVQKTLSSLYWLFKDSPARREDYSKMTGGSVFPLKFCQHRWLENVSVAERALEVWPHIVKYVNAIKAKKVADPKSKSYGDHQQ